MTDADEINSRYMGWMNSLSADHRDCVECGQTNPADAPCCGACGGDLEPEDGDD